MNTTDDAPPTTRQPSRVLARRWWAILLVGLLIAAFLPTVVEPSTAGSPPRGANLAAQILPTLAPTWTRTATHLPTRTRTPLQPVAPTATRKPTRAPTNTQPPPPRATLPPSAMVDGMFGYGQQLPLSCESRSAADWARHFGITIHELEFFSRLPTSVDNPDKGFVGSVYGSWGQIPPGSYGVHAAPVAELLRTYGASARAEKQFTMEELMGELAAGRPVMVWVSGHTMPGTAIPYEVDGQTILVARHEHTVIVIGYDDERDRVTILDGRDVYQRTFETFDQSWSALDRMAIFWHAE